MEERTYDKMVKAALTVKGEMSNFLTSLGSETSNNLSDWASIRGARTNGCAQHDSDGSGHKDENR